MALTLAASNSRTVSLAEFVEFVRDNVDLRDIDSIATAAPMLRGLANDRELVVRHINKQVSNLFRGRVIASAQTVFLAEGENFFVRANIWPSSADVSNGRVYQDQFAYDVAHDHNYNFLTVGYLGPGYVSEIYEYDYDKIEGYPGEPVEMRFLERKLFTTGNVMLYRASRDLHVQFPPEDLSITLNLMTCTPEVMLRDQYFFDLERRTLMNCPPEADNSRRVSILAMAGRAGNADTLQLLADLARQHPSRRARLAAFESQARLDPAGAEAVWEAACKDREALVAHAARRKLDELSRG
ncbi:MAG: hypothetical protein ISP90_05150 [Nevskia sp.]|nr:hypothetical protein [Nevskia sp.]